MEQIKYVKYEYLYLIVKYLEYEYMCNNQIQVHGPHG